MRKLSRPAPVSTAVSVLRTTMNRPSTTKKRKASQIRWTQARSPSGSPPGGRVSYGAG
jgi:hypothetical protein